MHFQSFHFGRPNWGYTSETSSLAYRNALRNALGDGLFCIGNRVYGILESQFFLCEGENALASF
jgi:hypothetical protein